MIRSKSLMIILSVTAAILLVPLVAMEFSDEWDWRLPDFIIIGTLLIGTGLLFELTLNKFPDAKHRVLIGLGLLAAMLLMYVQLAVGIVDTPFRGN